MLSLTTRLRALRRLLTYLALSSTEKTTIPQLKGEVEVLVNEIEEMFRPDPLPKFVLRDAYGEPEINSEPNEDGDELDERTASVGWDIDFGARITIGPDMDRKHLVVGLSLSDEVVRRGLAKNRVTRDQIRQYGKLLLTLADNLPEVESELSPTGK